MPRCNVYAIRWVPAVPKIGAFSVTEWATRQEAADCAWECYRVFGYVCDAKQSPASGRWYLHISDIVPPMGPRAA